MNKTNYRPQIYLVARYSRRLELCGYREQLQQAGFMVQSRWLDGKHQLSVDGTPLGDAGEHLIESGSEEAASLRAKLALDDWQDVSAAALVISFTEPPRTENSSRGGRHVEFGIALARGVRVMVIGHRENIFHWLPAVEFFQTWAEAFNAI